MMQYRRTQIEQVKLTIHRLSGFNVVNFINWNNWTPESGDINVGTRAEQTKQARSFWLIQRVTKWNRLTIEPRELDVKRSE